MSTMETEKQQQPEKEPGIEECFENAMTIEANFLVTGNEAMEYAVIAPDGCRRLLPLELNCEIFKCLADSIQTKFIWAMGQGIYAAFRHKLLVKTKRLRNPPKNCWVRTKKTESISPDGLTINKKWKYYYSKLAFRISGNCRKMDNYPGTILYYFEVARKCTPKFKCRYYVGLSNGNISDDGQWIPSTQSYYYFGNGSDYCTLDKNKHIFEWPNGTIKPILNGRRGDVIGCGLVLRPNNQLAIFFTLNGILLGKQIQINKPLANYLYPIVIMDGYANMPLHTNFGDDPDIPFNYDIEKCPGLSLD